MSQAALGGGSAGPRRRTHPERSGLMPAARRPGSGTPVGRPAPGHSNTDEHAAEHAAGPADSPRGRPRSRSAGRGVVVLRPAARVDRLVRVAAQGGGVAPVVPDVAARVPVTV